MYIPTVDYGKNDKPLNPGMKKCLLMEMYICVTNK